MSMVQLHDKKIVTERFHNPQSQLSLQVTPSQAQPWKAYLPELLKHSTHNLVCYHKYVDSCLFPAPASDKLESVHQTSNARLQMSLQWKQKYL
jgi:hypothetical protein